MYDGLTNMFSVDLTGKKGLTCRDWAETRSALMYLPAKTQLTVSQLLGGVQCGFDR